MAELPDSTQIMLDLVSGTHPLWQVGRAGDFLARAYGTNQKLTDATIRGDLKRAHADIKYQLERLETMYPFLTEKA